MTYTELIEQLPARQAADTLGHLVPFNLSRVMRANHVTIRTLAARMDVTMKRVRQVRAATSVPYVLALDYLQAAEDRLPGPEQQAAGYVRAITSTVNRYWDGCMAHGTYKSHLRSLWGTIQAKGLAEPVTGTLDTAILNALQRVAYVPRKVA